MTAQSFTLIEFKKIEKYSILNNTNTYNSNHLIVHAASKSVSLSCLE